MDKRAFVEKVINQIVEKDPSHQRETLEITPDEELLKIAEALGIVQIITTGMYGIKEIVGFGSLRDWGKTVDTMCQQKIETQRRQYYSGLFVKTSITLKDIHEFEYPFEVSTSYLINEIMKKDPKYGHYEKLLSKLHRWSFTGNSEYHTRGLYEKDTLIYHAIKLGIKSPCSFVTDLQKEVEQLHREINMI